MVQTFAPLAAPYALTPYNPVAVESQLAQLQQQQNNADLGTDTLPTQVAAAQSQLQGLDLTNVAKDTANQSSALSLLQQQAQDKVSNEQRQRTEIAQAAAIAAMAADPNAAWDKAMAKLDASGNPEAGSLVGQYSPALQQRVVNAYAAPNPQSTLAAGQAPTGAGGLGTMPSGSAAPGVSAGATPTDWTAQFSNMTPDQLNQTKTKLQAVDDAINQVANASDPVAAFHNLAPQFGFTGQIAPADIPATLAKLRAETEPALNAVSGQLLRSGAGLAAPKPPAEIQVSDGTLFKIDRSDPQNPKVTPLTALDPARTLGGAGTPGPNGAISPQDFAAKIDAAENSTGDPNAKNPNSSATGNGQFINSTWIKMVKTNRPDLADGKTDQQILALRSDPALSAQMTASYAVENGMVFAAAGQPVTSATLAMAHRLGPGDAEKVLAATPGTQLSDLLSPAVMKANPDLNGKTAGGFTAAMVGKFGMAPVQIPGVNGAGLPPTAGAMANSTTGSDIHGPDYLKTITPAMASEVQALAEGRKPFPTGRATSDPYWRQMSDAVLQYDPTFNQSDYNARAKTRASFTSGPTAANITSYNTSIGHLEQLSDSIDNLHNTGIPFVNNAAQTLGTSLGNKDTQKAVADFNTVKGAVASELVKSLRGSGGAEADIQYWQGLLNSADSPTALHAVVQHAAGLLGARVEALQQQYNTGMGTSNLAVPGLSPTASTALAKLQGVDQIPANKAAGAQVAAGTMAPKVGAVVKGYTFQGGNPSDPHSWVKVAGM